jgi:hypothetical protein
MAIMSNPPPKRIIGRAVKPLAWHRSERASTDPALTAALTRYGTEFGPPGIEARRPITRDRSPFTALTPQIKVACLGAIHTPPSRARAKGQDASQARQQARPQIARSGARHKGNRKDYRPRRAAGGTSPAPATPHQGAARVSRGPRRSAEGKGEMTPT